METNLLNKATFVEVYRFLSAKQNDDIFKCFKNLFRVALLFFPALMCQDVAIITDLTNIATGATLVGAGVATIVRDAAKSAFALFKNKPHSDYATRYDQIQIAQVMLIYAAYFDTISKCLPDENDEIALSDGVKWKISVKGYQTYFKDLEKDVQRQSSRIPKPLIEEITLPDPTQNFSHYTNRLKNFYDALNDEFKKFFSRLSFWKEIDSNQKEYFNKLLSDLPELSVHTYEQQYFELSKNFPDFAIWANHEDHTRLERQIDIGFKQMAEELKQFYISQRDNEVTDTLSHYQVQYTNYITRPTIKNSKDFPEDVVFPSQKEIFVPQAFQALSYRANMQLEQKATWDNAYAGEEIGQYIRSVLCHPTFGSLPLLILGLPGAGKTLLCHMLAAQILSSEYYVIIINLRDTLAEDTIMEQINAQIKRDLGDDCSWHDLRKTSLDKPLMLIFDGYDELLQATGKTYSDYLNKIAEFQLTQQTIYNVLVRCIVTSRVTLIDKASIPNNSQILRLCDFDDERIKAWCSIWNQANEQFFTAHKLNKLTIASTGKVRELAGQPLLLLMLALYDMNGNHLHEQSDISRAELYYKLIYDFVGREQEKNTNFNNLNPQKKKLVIQGVFHHLAIVALGMYNRRKLFIRTTELKEDIALLIQERKWASDAQDNVLEPEDKLISSFFFIHSSKSTTQVNKSHVQISAYEFLHNTFGEFLTAYYILETLFHLVKRQINDIDQDEIFSWPTKLKKEWHIGLAYAPLFTRPVVLNMIHELSIILAKENNLEEEEVKDALTCIFREELRQIIQGNVFSNLNDTLTMQGNPFEHPELLVNVAIYSVNLILLKSTVCTDSFVFTEVLGSNADWKKISNIWRYAFSEEELVSLSYLLVLTSSDKTYTISYRYDEEAANRSESLSKLNKLFHISSILGDDAAYAVYGAFNNPINDRIRSILKNEKLTLETQYALNAVVQCLSSSLANKKKLLISLMDDLLVSCYTERNALGLYVYCSLLHTLMELHVFSKRDIGELLDRRLFSTLLSAVDRMPSDNTGFLLSIIFQEILESIYILPIMERMRIVVNLAEIIGHETSRSYHYSRQLNIFNKYITNIFSYFYKTVQSGAKEHRIREIGEMCYDFLTEIYRRYIHFISWDALASVLQLSLALERTGHREIGMRILDLCFHEMDIRYLVESLPRNKKLSSPLYSTLIDCCYCMTLIYDYTLPINFRYIFEEAFQRMEDIRLLLPTYEDSFYNLLCLLCNDNIASQYPIGNLRSDVYQIVKQYGKQLPIYILRKAAEFGELVRDESICWEVEQLIKI